MCPSSAQSDDTITSFSSSSQNELAYRVLERLTRPAEPGSDTLLTRR